MEQRLKSGSTVNNKDTAIAQKIQSSLSATGTNGQPNTKLCSIPSYPELSHLYNVVDPDVYVNEVTHSGPSMLCTEVITRIGLAM